MGKFIDLTGQQFGRLTVIKRVENGNHGKVRWLCQCDCGKNSIVISGGLRNKNTQSCGCLNKEILTKHGHASYHKSKTYKTWNDMIQRCINPNCKAYKDYGGRGIQVCKRWLKFENFLQDMGEKPEGLTLDRIDNDGDYRPENCRWATRKEQNRNSRHNRLITINGNTKCLSEWCNFYNINYHKIYMRLHHGWSPEEAFELVLRRKSNG